MNSITKNNLPAAGILPETNAEFPSWISNEKCTTNEILRSAARRFGDNQFLDFLGQTYSFNDVQKKACELANGLRNLGVKKGHTVVTIMDNSADTVFILFAINKLGAISVPVNTAYKGEFLRHQVADASAAIVIAESYYADRVSAVAEGLPDVTTLLYRGETPQLSPTDWNTLPWNSLFCGDASDPDVEVTPGDLSMLIYTGGTTGPSKGCMVSHNYACNLATQMHRVTNRDESTITWTPLPMFHFNAVSSTVLSNMMVGARVALYPRFSVSNFWPEIERTQANEVSLLASMFTLLAQADENGAMTRCFGQVKTAIGAPFPPEIQKIWKDRFGIQHGVVSGFGLTECALVTLQPKEITPAPGSSGMHCDDFDVRIVDDYDQEQPVGTPGEIVVRPRKPHVMFEGYWKRADDTLKVMRNLWFHTGDIGKFDKDGYFYFVDRKKDYLRRRGENISSFEVENAFRNHKAIEEVAAHAVLSSLGEDELKITVVLRAGEKLSERDLFLWSMDHLPYFATPRYIEFRNNLPRNPVGRVLKYKLREEGVTSTTWDHEKSDIKINKR